MSDVRGDQFEMNDYLGAWEHLVDRWSFIVGAFERTDVYEYEGTEGSYDSLAAEAEKAIERFVIEEGGYMENTGGGVMVGIVRLDDFTSATITDESIHLWIDRAPFSADSGDRFATIYDVTSGKWNGREGRYEWSREGVIQ